jgi:hypothetical protein
LFMTIPTVHVHLAPSVNERADVRDFNKMISELISEAHHSW